MNGLYIGLDRDGTIELPNYPAPLSMLEEVRSAQREGAHLFIASGKSYDALKAICSKLELTPWLYCCENGGHIVIPQRGIDYSVAVSADLQFFLDSVPSLALPPHRNEPKTAIWTKCFGNRLAEAQAIISAFIARHGLQLRIYTFAEADGALDVVPEGIDKSNLLRFLPTSAVIHFFGDGANDLGLMRAERVVPHTVANGADEVKQCVKEKGGCIADLPAGHGVGNVLARLRSQWQRSGAGTECAARV